MINGTRFKRGGYVIIVAMSIVAIAIAQQRFNSTPRSLNRVATEEDQVKNNTQGVRNNEEQSLIHLLRDKQVITFGHWIGDGGEDKTLSYIVRAFDHDPKYDEGRGVKLSIFDQMGAVVYEQYFKEIHSIYITFALRKPTPQLAMEGSYGGNSSGLEMLDFIEGKVVNITDAIDNDFRSGAEVRPQFRTGVVPAKEPYQIMLTKPGLASDFERTTSVYRYDDGKYQYRGKFSQQKVDDYIEKLLSEEATNKKNQSKIMPK